jgi:hypothetical protein
LPQSRIWSFVLFLTYTLVNELNARLGDGEPMKIFFTRRSSVMKSTPLAANSRASRGSAGEPRYNHMKTKPSSVGETASQKVLRALNLSSNSSHPVIRIALLIILALVSSGGTLLPKDDVEP